MPALKVIMRAAYRRHLLPALALAVLTAAALGDGRTASLVVEAAGQDLPGAPADQYTPIIQLVLSTPRWFLGTDRRVHLAYELLLTNAFPVGVPVTSVEVLDGGSGHVVATLSGDELTAALSPLAGGPVAPLPPSMSAVVWLDLTFADRASLPAAVEHRVTAAVSPGLGVPQSIAAVGGRAEVDARPPVVLGPPLLRPRWVAVGSCCDGQHRRSLQPLNGTLHLAQRFAIDFNLLDAEGRFTAGDPRRNESTAGYGQPVIAVAGSTVVAAVDRYPDQTPGDSLPPATLERIGGNHVILDLGEGRFAYYAHLRPGTVAVQVGERVRRGQQLGELGSSGNSTGPHLHFHVMDRASALAADGLPYVFDAFVLTGRTPPIAELLSLEEAQLPVPIDTAGAGPRRDALPLGGDELTFPLQSRPPTLPPEKTPR